MNYQHCMFDSRITFDFNKIKSLTRYSINGKSSLTLKLDRTIFLSKSSQSQQEKIFVVILNKTYFLKEYEKNMFSFICSNRNIIAI